MSRASGVDHFGLRCRGIAPKCRSGLTQCSRSHGRQSLIALAHGTAPADRTTAPCRKSIRFVHREHQRGVLSTSHRPVGSARRRRPTAGSQWRHQVLPSVHRCSRYPVQRSSTIDALASKTAAKFDLQSILRIVENRSSDAAAHANAPRRAIPHTQPREIRDGAVPFVAPSTHGTMTAFVDDAGQPRNCPQSRRWQRSRRTWREQPPRPTPHVLPAISATSPSRDDHHVRTGSGQPQSARPKTRMLNSAKLEGTIPRRAV